MPHEVGSVNGGIDNGEFGLCLNHGLIHHVVPAYDLEGNNTEVTSVRASYLSMNAEDFVTCNASTVGFATLLEN